MILTVDDWKFQIFQVATRKYYARELAEHCTCAACRNFYATVDGQYPHLRQFLADFGIQIEAPDEMMTFEPTLCSDYYAVCGTILERGQGSIVVDGISIDPLTEEVAKSNTWLSRPLFFLSVGPMTLPWVLDEPAEEDTLPNKSNAIQRLLGRWITDET